MMAAALHFLVAARVLARWLEVAVGALPFARLRRDSDGVEEVTSAVDSPPVGAS